MTGGGPKRGKALATNEPRKISLASQVELSSVGSAFERLVLEDGPNVQHCRSLLLKPVELRNLEEVHTVPAHQPPLAQSSTPVDQNVFQHIENRQVLRQPRSPYVRPLTTGVIVCVEKESEFYRALQLQTLLTPSSYVFRQGEPGDKFYVIFSGQVEVRKWLVSPTGESIESFICELRPGDCFGDRALTGGLNETHPREASIVTLGDKTELAFMDKVSYSKIMRETSTDARGADMPKSPGLEVAKRFRSNKDIVRTIFLQPAHERTERDLKFAVEYLKGVKFFARFSFEVRKQLCKALRLVCAWTNTTVFEEGQPGHHFYILFSGCVEVLITTTNRYDQVVQTVVSTLKEAETFGELALSEENGCRRATVAATEYTELLTLSRDDYVPLIQKYQNQYHSEYVRMLSQNPYFMGDEWDATTLEAMCSVMVEKYFPFEGEICKQGSRATEMFVVVRGECVAKYEGKDPFTNEPITVALGRFGPNSVMGCAEATAGKFNDVFVRTTSIYATSPVKVRHSIGVGDDVALQLLVLSRFDIFHLLSPEARASLQRWSHDEQAESLDSRVLKTIVWEKYRSNFMADFVATHGLHADPVTTPTLPAMSPHRSTLAPLKTINIQDRQVVDAGEIQLYPRPKLMYSSSHGHLPDQMESPWRRPASMAGKSIVDSKQGQLKLAKTNKPPDVYILESTHSTTGESHPKRSSLTGSASMPSLPPLTDHDARNSVATPAVSTTGVTHIHPFGRASTPDRAKTPAAANAGIHHTRQFLWAPLHGIYLPFSIVGLGRSAESRAPMAFRVCGKFRDLDGALDMFHDICKLEPVSGGGDHGSFVVYKDADVSMTLQNMQGDAAPTPATMTHSSQPPIKDRLKMKRTSVVVGVPELPKARKDMFPDSHAIVAAVRRDGHVQVIGQRFACIGLSDTADDMHVYVYHTFPTPQSAIRHTKHLVSMLNAFADNCLYVVPLFEWIHRDELERYEARNTDLDSLLDGKSSTASKYSGWKARKEAVRKRQGHLYQSNG
ncbi:Aste57867_10110 [Aphanomyces stellatus]|uniref:Aste57867_10110 protein n=1 Tax=Aphanomyces stellatus TaxID=120398 RepID=A0A485KQ94_9STRA|nr:hypothetical protein As57867_010071 [Aphanomyces stellatus]VFT86986.1 Aste57867_10110 [Aphanomyces stellatus]